MEDRPFSIFFAWQSDTEPPNTRDAIRAALNVASNRVAGANSIRIILDEAAREVSGAPYIPAEIVRKIRTADVFVADITSIYRFPNGGKSIPNPNVAFETGVAAAHLGWNRVILLFNEQAAKLENMPFDFDRHRISCYSLDQKAKRLEGRIEPLASLLVNALSLIARDRPKRPSELGETEEQIKINRDRENIVWFMRQFSVDLLHIHLRDAPEMLHYFAPYMHDGMEHVLDHPRFQLYDQKALKLIRSLKTNLGKTLAYDHLYRDLNNQFIQGFGRRDEHRNFGEEQRAAAEIVKAISETRRSLNALIGYIRKKYLEIDINATSAHAAMSYNKSISPDANDLA